MKLYGNDDKNKKRQKDEKPQSNEGKKRNSAGRNSGKPPKAPREKKQGGNMNPKAKTAVFIIAIAVAVLVAAAAAGTYFVSTVNTIYPNVTLDGINISGMNLPEVARTLDENGYEGFENKTLEVKLPLDFSLNINAGEVGATKPVTEIAQDAWDACHGKSAIGNAVTYLKCIFAGLELQSDENITIDETAVRAQVESIVHELNMKLMSSDVTVGEDSIIVIKGAKSIIIDADELSELIVSALNEKNFDTIEYKGQIGSDTELDVQKLHETVFCEPADAEYDKETDTVLQHTCGMDFDMEEAKRLWDSADYGDKVIIPITVTEPEMTKEKLEKLLFADCLSAKTTSLIGSSANRVNNVKKAAESINEMVLMPGEEFSYNDALGERTAANGYLMAGAYSGGQVTQEYGGGICQVSSTLYFCALYANLQISSRTCHMFPVGYLPAGLDATVSWGGPEFKFVNNREYPIKIISYVKDNTASVEIWGTDVDGSYVQMTYATWFVFDTKYKDVAIGYKAQTYRSVFDKDGNLIKKTNEALSFYNYHEEDIEWPEESPSPSPSASPSPTPSATPTPTPTVTPPVTQPPAETTAPVLPETDPTPGITPVPTDPVGGGAG